MVLKNKCANYVKNTVLEPLHISEYSRCLDTVTGKSHMTTENLFDLLKVEKEKKEPQINQPVILKIYLSA